MKPSRPMECLIEKIRQHLSNAPTVFENLLSEISIQLWAAVKRTVRYVQKILRLGLKDLGHLLRLVSMFLALVWLGSGFHELTYYQSWALKMSGWAGAFVFGAVILAGIVVFFQPSASATHSHRKAATPIFVLIHVIVVLTLLFAIHSHYQLRSPVLKSTESLLSAILMKSASVETPVNPADDFQSSGGRKLGANSSFFWERFVTWINSRREGARESLPSAPALLVSVKCKGTGNDGWARTDSFLDHLNMWVEKAEQTETDMILDIAVKTWSESTTDMLDKATGAYFVDDVGTKYQLEIDKGNYSDNGKHTCTGDEIYRFQLVFPKLNHHSSYIYLHHPQFERLEVDLDWPGEPPNSR